MCIRDSVIARGGVGVLVPLVAGPGLIPLATFGALHVFVSPHQGRGHRPSWNDKGLRHESAKQQSQNNRHRDRFDGFPPATVGRLVLLWILSLIHISEPTRLLSISYAVFCLKK